MCVVMYKAASKCKSTPQTFGKRQKFIASKLAFWLDDTVKVIRGRGLSLERAWLKYYEVIYGTFQRKRYFHVYVEDRTIRRI